MQGRISKKTIAPARKYTLVARATKLLCIILGFSGMLHACNSESGKNERIAAKVGSKYLYFRDMKNIFPKGCTKDDSLSLARLYIDNWIETQLMLQKAELNLSNEQANISKEIETYRTSLLIYKYEEQLLSEKLDTIVSENEIQSHHEANAANFLLDEYAVKAYYFKIPIDAPNINDVKRWYVSDKEKDIESLTHYCYNYAAKYKFFDDEWVLWSVIASELPHRETAAKQISQYGHFEQEDAGFIYLVRIKEKLKPGEVMPLDIVKDRVKNIIINKRKLKFISELERNIYNDALRKKQFEIYDLN